MAGKLPALVLLALALFGAWQGASLVQDDLAFNAARTQVSFWGRGNYQPTAATVDRTGKSIDTLVQHSGHPEYLSLQAAWSSWRSHWTDNAGERAGYANRAVASQYAAMELRPAHRHGWIKMVEYASRDASGAARLEQAEVRLQALQPAQ